MKTASGALMVQRVGTLWDTLPRKEAGWSDPCFGLLYREVCELEAQRNYPAINEALAACGAFCFDLVVAFLKFTMQSRPHLSESARWRAKGYARLKGQEEAVMPDVVEKLLEGL